MVQQYDSVTAISGIGPKYQKVLEALNINTVLDLVNHIPFRYEDRSNVKKIAELIPESESSTLVTVEKISNVFTRRGYKLTKARVKDETGFMDIVWFNQTYIAKSVKPDDKLLLFGKVAIDGKRLTFQSPEWEIITGEIEDLPRIVPVYPATEGLSSKWIAKKIAETIQQIDVSEYLPEDIINTHNLLSRYEALKKIHLPRDFSEIENAKRRLAFDELLFIHFEGLKIRNDWANKTVGHVINIPKEKLEKYIEKSPFILTSAQSRSITEIISDLGKQNPMNRLLQGDVGSGKTAVAEAAIFATLESGFNAILMAPTQILAKQHYLKIKPKLEDFGYTTELLTGDNRVLDSKTDKNKLVIATHAILHNLDKFNKIGLIIIDEQHKFGVEQRSKVVEHYTQDKIVPNLLTMTATPIPRSLALTLYGDLDLSVIDELPAERKKVITWVVNEPKRLSAYKWILNEIDTNKNQVFVVCPFIEESDIEGFREVKAAEKEYEKLRKIFPSRIKIDMLHGRSKDKETIVEQFRNGKTQILVATPVIEVGIDVPAANIMLIENPERFGLASLHQLRGRVGRGGEQGYCILIVGADAEETRRIKYMETVHNGAELAEIDLKLRGPGNIYGTQQHGYLYLKIADLTDLELIRDTKEVAQHLFVNREKYPKINMLINTSRYIDDQ